MAEEETNSRISELKARLEADPGSRVFYQLGEELRKSEQLEQAESVLREGLEKHSGYLSAWISLGRVLQEMSRSEEAIEVLNRAFELDRQNVVVARLLGDAYMDIGEHVEAIKKYKLVAALHPADEEIQSRIAELEETLRGEKTPAMYSTAAPEVSVPPLADETPLETSEDEEPAPEPPVTEEFSLPETQEDPSSEGRPDWQAAEAEDEAQGDTAEPLSSPEQESEDTAGSASEDRLATTTEVDPWDDTAEDIPEEAPEDVVATITMGDLYARQGHVEQARSIYRRILEREPSHDEAQERLDSLAEGQSPESVSESPSESPGEAKIQRLEEWLSRIKG